MIRRSLRLFIGTLVLVAVAEIGSAADAARQPNIVILLADDMGFADVGFQGCKDIPTPNIDSLAANGVRCTNGYVSGVYCSPTRAGLLTGRYQTRFGHEYNPGRRDDEGSAGLPLTETTLADRLKAAGYATGLVGKWHLGGATKFQPQRRGFTEYFGFLAGAHPYFPGQGQPILRGTEVVNEQEYLTDAFAREAVAFVDRHQSHPFLLYLAFNAVHTPMHATDERLKRFESIADKKRRTYAAMLVAMDEAIGKVLEKLRTAGLEENTLVFFFSDNGGPAMLGTTINGSNNAPLRGSKRTTLEGGIHVPFAVQWKGKLPAGTVYEQPVIQLDIHPTCLAAAGVDIKPEWKLDGVNILPHLSGKESKRPHETLYWKMGKQSAVRHGDWKLVKYDANADSAEPRRRGAGVTEAKLYNLAADIGESRDLAKDEPAKAAELQSLFDRWKAEQLQPVWGPNGG